MNLSRQTLQAGAYSLSPLARGDARDLLALFSDPEVVEFMDIDPLRGLDEARDIIDWARELAGRGAGLRWSIRRAGEGRVIGTCGFNAIELERGRRGEVAYDLARAEWGRGVMAEVLPHVMAFGFEALGLRRLEAMVTVGNGRSCALLERQGFHREGLLRDHAWWKGRYWDQLIYGRVAD